MNKNKSHNSNKYLFLLALHYLFNSLTAELRDCRQGILGEGGIMFMLTVFSPGIFFLHQACRLYFEPQEDLWGLSQVLGVGGRNSCVGFPSSNTNLRCFSPPRPRGVVVYCGSSCLVLDQHMLCVPWWKRLAAPKNACKRCHAPGVPWLVGLGF